MSEQSRFTVEPADFTIEKDGKHYRFHEGKWVEVSLLDGDSNEKAKNIAEKRPRPDKGGDD